jgi:tetratricopeptide (TPR) repeat protein/cell division protein FtsN
MFYLIAAVLLILIIALVFIFRAPKIEKPEEEPVLTEATTPVEHEVGEEESAPEELGLEIEAEADKAEGVPGEEEYVELSFDDEIVTDRREAVHEDYAELSLDDDETVTEPPEETVSVTEESEGEIDVSPALAGATDESEVTEEAPPEELVDKLNYYFGGDEAPLPEEAETAVEEEEPAAVEQAAEPEVTAEELDLEEPVVEEDIPEPDVTAALTLEKYTEDLRNQEAELRRDLAAVTGENATDKRFVLEQKLQVICEKQASIDSSFNRQMQLIDTTEKVLAEVHDELLQKDLAGLDMEEAVRQLRHGNFGEVESILTEASLRLDDAAEVYSTLFYQCGQLAEERLDVESAFEDYRNACVADNNNPRYLLTAGRTAGKMGHDQDAQSWLEKLVREDGEKEEQTVHQAEAQYELAQVYARIGEKEKAGELFKRSIDKAETILGKDHPELGPIMHHYAVLLESNGMYEQAEEYYTKALEVMERGYGKDHPKLGSTLNKLAGLYEELEFEDKAEPLYERALSIKERILGQDHHDVGSILNNLAELLRRQGKLEQSEPLFKKSLEISENELGKDHPNLAVVLNNMAELYSQMGKEEEAALYQERAFSLFGLPGMDGDFVEMEKDDIDIDDDKNQTIAGS